MEEVFFFKSVTPDYLKDYVEDPMQYKGGLIGGAYIYLVEEVRKDTEFACMITQDLLISCGDKDDICEVEFMKKFHAEASSVKRAIKIYDCGHYILYDGWINEKVIQD